MVSSLPEQFNEFFKQYLVGNYLQAIEIAEHVELGIEEYELNLVPLPTGNLRSFVTEMCYPFFVAYLATLFTVVVTEKTSSNVSIDNVNSLKYLLKRIQGMGTVSINQTLTVSQQVAKLLCADNLFCDLTSAVKCYWRSDLIGVINIIDQLASAGGPCNFSDGGGSVEYNPKQVVSQSLTMIQRSIRSAQYNSISGLYNLISTVDICDLVKLPKDTVLKGMYPLCALR